MNAFSSLLERALKRFPTDHGKEDLAEVKVGILDSGIDGSHPDLQGKVISAVIAQQDEDDKATVVPSDPNANNDLYGHGTAVASIIARIAPHARFIDVRVLGGNNLGRSDLLIAGLRYAVTSGANLLNMSLAVNAENLPQIAPLCDQAYRRGIPIIAARRNRPLLDEGYPASLIPCIGVGNAGQGPEAQWRYKTSVIEFEAFGVDVPAAAPGGGYTTVTGTSFATPIVAGIVALMLGAHPELRPFEIKALLKAYCEGEGPAPI